MTGQALAPRGQRRTRARGVNIETLVRASCGPAAFVSLDGSVTAVNGAWRHFAANNDAPDPNAFLGANYLRVCETAAGPCSEEASAVAKGLRQVLDAAASEFVQTYPCHSPVQRRWFKCMITPVATDHGLIGALVQHVETTDEVESRLSTAAKMELLARAAGGVGGHAWEWDLPARTIHASANFVTLIGPEVPHPWSALAIRRRIHPDDLPGFDAAMTPVLAGGTDYIDAEYRVLDAAGDWRWLHTRGYAERDHSGHCTRLVGISLDVTSRKAFEQQAEAARREALRMALVAEKTDNAVIVTDHRGRIEWTNAGFTRMTGWSLEEVRGLTPGSLLQGRETNPQEDAEMRAAVREMRPSTVEIVNYHRDGHPYWVEIDLQPVLSDTDGQAHFIAIERNVTVRKLRQTLAQARIAVLDQMASGASQPEILTTLARAIEDGAIGMKASILLLDAPGERLQVAAAPSLPEPYTRALDGVAVGPAVGSCGSCAYSGERVIAEDIYTHPYWTDYAELATLSEMRACWSEPIKAEDGRVLGALALYYEDRRRPTAAEIELIQDAAAICSSVLLRFQAEAERAIGQQRMAAMAESVPVRIAYVDREGIVRYANTAYSAFHGVDSAEIVGRSLRGVIGEIAWETVSGHLEAALTGQRQRFEARLVFRPDLVSDARVTLIPDVAADGSVVGVYKLDEDLTEFRERERVLEEARAAAEAGNRAKSNFLANMSHELRTPLNAIIGYAEIMRAELLGPIGNERYAGYADDIYTSGHYLLSLIEDVLDLSRLEAGGRRMRAEPVDLAAAVQHALTVQGIADDGRVEVRAEPGVVAWADQRAVRQILVNLIRNATTHGGGAPVQVVLSAHPGISVIKVIDKGPGIPESDLPRILEPFYTSESSALVTKPGLGGTGIGLTLVNRLTDALGGTLSIDSELGRGTSVRVELPAAAEATGDPAVLKAG